MIALGERLGLFEHAQDFEVRLAQEELAAEVLRLDGAAGVGDGPFVEARLDERAEVLRLLELVEQPEHGLIEEVAQPEGVDVVAQLVFREAHVEQFDDAGPDEVLRLEESTGLFPGLEDEGQLGELGGAGADLQPVQIVPQDEGGDLGGRVAFLLVDEGEQVEGVGEHVPAADGGIAQADFLGFGDFEEVVRRAAGGVLFALDVVGHVLAQPGAGAIEKPEPAEGVFDEVADDPVRGEELGDGGDVLGGHGALAGHDLVLPLGDVELVEPAEDFHVGAGFARGVGFQAVGIGDLGAKAFGDGSGGEKVVGEKEFRFVVELVEDVGEQGVVKAARGEDEAAISLALRIGPSDGGGQATIEQVVEALEVGVRVEFRRQGASAEELEDFRLCLLRRGGSKNASLEWMPTLGIEKAQRSEAVEPSVSDALDKGGTVPPIFLAEGCHLICSLSDIWRVGGEHVVELAPDCLHELVADGGSERF